MLVLLFVRNLFTDDEVRSNRSSVDYPKCIFFAKLIDRLQDPYSDSIEKSICQFREESVLRVGHGRPVRPRLPGFFSPRCELSFLLVSAFSVYPMKMKS